MPDSDLITAELLRKAKQELQEKPEWKERDVQALRDMVLANGELNCRMDDAFLLRFLRARKFDYDRAYQLLQNYYTIRLQNAHLYVNFRPSAVLNVFDQNMQMMLSKRDQLGRKVFIFRAGKWNPERCSLDDIFRANQMCLENAIEEEETQINGFVAIVDMMDFGVQQGKHFRPAYAKRVISLIQDCFPGRFKGFHLVNEHAIFDMVFVVIKPFLTDKIKNRIYCHGYDMKSLHEHICPDILPEEFGGSQPPMNNSEFVRALLEKDDEFYSNTKFGYSDTSNRNEKIIESFDGVVGSYYRKLCVD